MSNYDGRKPEPPYQTIDDLQAEAFAKGVASRQGEIDALRAEVAMLRAQLTAAEDRAVMRATEGEAKGRREAQPKTDDYVAWLRYQHHDGDVTTIHVCDSDAPGAFRVYRARGAEVTNND